MLPRQTRGQQEGHEHRDPTDDDSKCMMPVFTWVFGGCTCFILPVFVVCVWLPDLRSVRLKVVALNGPTC